jgi:hypothetical protein
MFVFKRGTLPLALFYLYSPLLHTKIYVILECFLESPCPNATLLTFFSFTDGRKERVQFDKITARVSRLCYGLDPEHVDAAAITQKVISGVYQGVTTIELDNLVGDSSQYLLFALLTT